MKNLNYKSPIVRIVEFQVETPVLITSRFVQGEDSFVYDFDE